MEKEKWPGRFKKARVYLNWLIDYEEMKNEATEKKHPHDSGRYSWSDGETSISRKTRDICEQLEKDFHEGVQEGIKEAEKLTEEGLIIDTIIFDSKSDAEEVLEQMNDLISRYGYVSVSDFYELCGLSSRYTDNMYGWDNISNAKIMDLSTKDFCVQLPNAKKIENRECKIGNGIIRKIKGNNVKRKGE